MKINLEFSDNGTFWPVQVRNGWLTIFISVVLLASTGAHAQEENRPDLESTWMGKLITFDDPRWSIEAVLCSEWCTLAQLEHVGALVADPANDDLALSELQQQGRQFNREYITSLFTRAAQEQSAQFDQSEDPVNSCEPVGLLIQAAAQPLPFKIEQLDDRVEISYEYWGVVRTIYTDGRTHSKDLAPSLYGHSVGWYDGSTLVVETRGLESRLYAVQDVDGLMNTEQAVVIERFSRSSDGNQLDQLVTVVDPRMLREPLISLTSYLSFPGMEFQKFECKVVSGEF